MAARSGDWSPLGLDGDPTPGDPDALETVADFMATMSRRAGDAQTGLNQVITDSGNGAFVGKTADWLRGNISDGITSFIGGVRTAFGDAEPALRTYIRAMREAQRRADAALSEARGLPADSPRLTTLTGDAGAAGSDLTTAASTAAKTIRTAAENIRSPKTGCEQFWEGFQYIALVITIVAVFTGGPLGLLAFGLNAVLAAKAVVDYSTGKTDLLGLGLGLLMLLGPSTKPLVSLTSLRAFGATARTFAKTRGVAVGRVAVDFWKTASALTMSTALAGIRDISVTIANSTVRGGLLLVHGAGDLAALTARGFVALPGYVVAAPRLAGAAFRAVRAGGAWTARVLSNSLGGMKWLHLFTPLEGVEIGKLGVVDAFRLAVLDRGLGLSDRFVGLRMHVAGFGVVGPIDGLRAVQADSHASLLVADGVLLPNRPLPAHYVELNSGLVVPSHALDSGVLASPGARFHPDGLSAVNPHTAGGVHGLSLADSAGLHLPAPAAAVPANGLELATPSGLHLAAPGDLRLGSPHLDGSGGLHLGAPGGATGIGDATGAAHQAIHHGGAVAEMRLPEVTAARLGEVTAVRVSDTGIAFNLGRLDLGVPPPMAGHGADALATAATHDAAAAPSLAAGHTPLAAGHTPPAAHASGSAGAGTAARAGEGAGTAHTLAITPDGVELRPAVHTEHATVGSPTSGQAAAHGDPGGYRPAGTASHVDSGQLATAGGHGDVPAPRSDVTAPHPGAASPGGAAGLETAGAGTAGAETARAGTAGTGTAGASRLGTTAGSQPAVDSALDLLAVPAGTGGSAAGRLDGAAEAASARGVTGHSVTGGEGGYQATAGAGSAGDATAGVTRPVAGDGAASAAAGSHLHAGPADSATPVAVRAEPAPPAHTSAPAATPAPTAHAGGEHRTGTPPSHTASGAGGADGTGSALGGGPAHGGGSTHGAAPAGGHVPPSGDGSAGGAVSGHPPPPHGGAAGGPPDKPPGGPPDGPTGGGDPPGDGFFDGGFEDLGTAVGNYQHAAAQLNEARAQLAALRRSGLAGPADLARAQSRVHVAESVLTKMGDELRPYGITHPEGLSRVALPDGSRALVNSHDGSLHRFDADGQVRRFDADGTRTGENLPMSGPDGAPLGRLDVDYRGGTATLHPTAGTRETGAYAQTSHGHQITTTEGRELHFTADGTFTHETIPVHDPTGTPHGRVTLDHTNGTATLDRAGTTKTFDHTVSTSKGHKLTTTAGDELLLAPDGRLLHERVIVHEPGTTVATGRLEIDYRTGRGTVHSVGGVSRKFDHTVLPDGSHRFTDNLPGPRRGEQRIYDDAGSLHSEHVNGLTRKGKADGTRFEIDHRAGTWERVDAATGDAPDVTYATAGRVEVQSGELRLIGRGRPGSAAGVDETRTVLSRETLPSGHTVEVFRTSRGRVYWHEWNGNASVSRGARVFETEADGKVWSDVTSRGRTMREYRGTPDGGLVRAERQADGSWRWQRYYADGKPPLEGTRVTEGHFYARVTKDFPDNGGSGPAQQHWPARTGRLRYSSRYRQYGIEVGPSGPEASPFYKEFSRQAKETGSLEKLGNGHHLELVRMTEQRPAQQLWKAPGDIDGLGGKLVAKSTWKYGDVDFPRSGWSRGDSQYQVFRWKEMDPSLAGHDAAASGVRVFRPDGSFSDFTKDGTFVRGTLKLDNGNTVEIGRAADGKWRSAVGGTGPGHSPLAWRELNSSKKVVAEGERHFTGDGHWVDTTRTASGDEVVRQTVKGSGAHVRDGDVVSFLGKDRPAFDPHLAAGERYAPASDATTTVTRDPLGQIVERTDRWGPDHVTGRGDPHKGDWTWSGDGKTGRRVSGRGEWRTGAWDDSYRDYRQNLRGDWELVRDYRSLDKGTGLAASKDATTGKWHSWEVDADGAARLNPDGSARYAVREWRTGKDGWGDSPPPGTKPVGWRDLDPTTGRVLRETSDGRVRVYDGQGRPVDAGIGHGTWKEYDHGAVFSKREEVTPGVFRESESFHGQWRETDAAGNLLRHRTLSGHVWERDPLGRWHISGGDLRTLGREWRAVGREWEYHGIGNEFRGYNRMWRETNRRQYIPADGLAGKFASSRRLLSQRLALDWVQDYLIDVGAQAAVMGAVYGGQNGKIDWRDWEKILVGAALSSTVRGANTWAHEATRLKAYRDGLANMDSGKYVTRTPYNHDKHWDNEWNGNENPPRWRSTGYNHVQGTLAVGMLSSFTSNTLTSLWWGVGIDNDPVTGLQALGAGGIGAAGTLLVGGFVGSGRTALHSAVSGRFFHRGSISDMATVFATRGLERYTGGQLLLKPLGLKPSSVVGHNPASNPAPPAPSRPVPSQPVPSQSAPGPSAPGTPTALPSAPSPSMPAQPAPSQPAQPTPGGTQRPPVHTP